MADYEKTLAKILGKSKKPEPAPDVLPPPLETLQPDAAPQSETQGLVDQAALLVADGLDPDVAMARVGLSGDQQAAVIERSAPQSESLFAPPESAPVDPPATGRAPEKPAELAYEVLRELDRSGGSLALSEVQDLLRGLLKLKRLHKKRLAAVMDYGTRAGWWVERGEYVEKADGSSAPEPEPERGPAPELDVTPRRGGRWGLLVLVDCAVLMPSWGGANTVLLDSILRPYIAEVEEETGVGYYRLLQYNAGPQHVVAKLAAALHAVDYDMSALVGEAVHAVLVDSRHPCASDALGLLRRVPHSTLIRRL